MLDPTDFDTIRRLALDEAGIDLGDDKHYLVEARLEPVASHLGYEGLSHLVSTLRRGGRRDLIDTVVDALTTNETSFFRDPTVFDDLADFVLPELVEARRRERRLRLWSAACSTGQEPYSLAMMLLERFPELVSWEVTILATDYSRTALQRAQDGHYSGAEVRRGVPDDLRDRYFRRASGGGWVVSNRVRERCAFHRLNLLHPWTEVGACDLVLMRNVLIYVRPSTRDEILRRVRQVIAPSGVLVLGSTEATPEVDRLFHRSRAGRTPVFRHPSFSEKRPEQAA